LPAVRVHIGSDHAGFELKAHLLAHLASLGHDVVDVGPATYNAGDDYPPYCIATGLAVLAEPGTLGIVIGGSGNGEQIAANKVPGIRAALAWNIETAKLARQHNNAQVVAIGARQHSLEDAAEFAAAFVAEPFSEDPRHQRRIDIVAEYEKTHQPPALSDA
jgi:ribose 5-phosphate isomerase B